MINNYYLTSSLGNMSSVVSLDLDTSWAARTWDLSNWYQLQDSYKLRLQNKALELKKEDETGVGRVRQLFEERRGGAGRDKSHPLEPLRRRVVSLDRLNHQKGDLSLKDGQSVERLSKTSNRQPTVAKFEIPKRLPNLGSTVISSQGGNNFTVSQELEKFSSMDGNRRPIAKRQPASIGSLNRSFGGLAVSSSLNDNVINQKIGSGLRKPTSISRSADSKLTKLPKPTIAGSPIKTADKVLLKDSIPTAPKMIERAAKTVASSQGSLSRLSTPSSAGSQKSMVKPVDEPQKPMQDPGDGRVPCKICTRYFLPDRLAVHEKICSKSKTKKRRKFDPVKHRLTGTEAEDYIKTIKSTTNKKPVPVKKSNWRKTHEDFVNSIRAAKEVSVHLAKGGKLSDLPPPPPMDTSNYTPCPHCGRKFNDAAAQRHIPKCVDMRHNKPKPATNAAKTSLKTKTAVRSTLTTVSTSRIRK